MISLLTPLAQAQDVPKPGLMVPSAPVHMQADQLIYEAGGNRVVARGNVEIHWGNHTLTADRVVYDEGANSLVAEGNAQLKTPDGITRADRFEAPGDFRDAFVRSLRMTAEEYSRALTPPGRTDEPRQNR